MFLGIVMIILGSVVALHSCHRGNKLSEDGNVAAVLWHWPWVVIGWLAVIKGLNMVGAV